MELAHFQATEEQLCELVRAAPRLRVLKLNHVSLPGPAGFTEAAGRRLARHMSAHGCLPPGSAEIRLIWCLPGRGGALGQALEWEEGEDPGVRVEVCAF